MAVGAEIGTWKEGVEGLMTVAVAEVAGVAQEVPRLDW